MKLIIEDVRAVIRIDKNKYYPLMNDKIQTFRFRRNGDYTLHEDGIIAFFSPIPKEFFE